MPSSPARATAVLLAMTSLAGCTVGPNYKAPAPQVASAFVAPADAGTVDEGRWWTSLHDPLLDKLVEEMLAGSPSLKEAQARLAEARASRDAVRGGTLPQAQASASANEVELSKNGQLPIGSIPGFARDFGLFDIGFDASWELDLWGRGRRQTEAADARIGQAEMAAQGMKLQLIAELARAYIDMRLAQRAVALTQDALEARQNLATLAGLRARAGETGRSETEQAEADLANAQGALAQAQAQERTAALRVVVLTGARPEAMLPRLAAGSAIPEPPQAIAAGLPSELLRRRPDIRVAERDLAAATADIGVATADLFPRLRLSLAVGQQARALGDLFSGDSTRAQAGPGLAWPIFSGGSARARIRVANARAEQAAARYDAAVITALSDSEGAIERFRRARAALAASDAALARDSTVLSLAKQRAAAGEEDKLALARASLAYIASMQRNAEARAGAADAAIALHKALGGGWSGPTG